MKAQAFSKINNFSEEQSNEFYSHTLSKSRSLAVDFDAPDNPDVRISSILGRASEMDVKRMIQGTEGEALNKEKDRERERGGGIKMWRGAQDDIRATQRERGAAREGAAEWQLGRKKVQGAEGTTEKAGRKGK